MDDSHLHIRYYQYFDCAFIMIEKATEYTESYSEERKKLNITVKIINYFLTYKSKSASEL